MKALGLMSGTSMDGIDVAVIDTDGERAERLGPARTYPYDPAFRARLRSVLGGHGDVAGVEAELTDLHAQAVHAFLAETGEAPEIVGFHGHTVLHAPEDRKTWQIGDGARLARALGLPVVNDLRAADVAAGGQGAPLAPAWHRALAAEMDKPVAVLNLGGVGNVTVVGEGEALVAFDTGPANALIDDWCARRTGAAMDDGGRLAASGTVNAEALDILMHHPYFAAPPPKSLDRDAFLLGPVEGLSAADGAATLTAFTAASVARARDHLAAAPDRWLVTGGGRRNPTLMGMLAARLDAPVAPVEAVGWDGDAMEAQAFAFLAVRSSKGLPITWPGTTGAPRPLTGGMRHEP